MTTQIIIQLLAIIFLILFALSYQAKSRKKILTIQIIALLSLALHYYLLDATTGLAMILIHAFMILIYLQDFHIFKLNSVLILFLLVYTVFMIITWQGFFSIFALLGISIATIAKWQINPQYIRLIAIPSAISWLLYNIFVFSYGGIISESIILLSLIISLIRNKKLA